MASTAPRSRLTREAAAIRAASLARRRKRSRLSEGSWVGGRFGNDAPSSSLSPSSISPASAEKRPRKNNWTLADIASLPVLNACELNSPFYAIARICAFALNCVELKNLDSKPETGYRHGEYKVNLSRREKKEWNEAHPDQVVPIHNYIYKKKREEVTVRGKIKRHEMTSQDSSIVLVWFGPHTFTYTALRLRRCHLWLELFHFNPNHIYIKAIITI